MLEMEWFEKYHVFESEYASYIANNSEINKVPGDMSQSTYYKKIIRRFYGDVINDLGDIHAYRLSANLGKVSSLNSQTVFELYPIDNPIEFEKYYGMTVQDVLTLYNENIIIPIIHDPLHYKDLYYLEPILKKKPASFEIRGHAFYRMISNGKYDDYLEIAKSIELLRNSDKYPALKEQYEKRTEIAPERIREKNYQRFAALASHIGQDSLVDILNVNTSNWEESIVALNKLFWLHYYILHPTFHGIFGFPHHELNPGNLREFKENIELMDITQKVILDKCNIAIPDNPNSSFIIGTHEAGIAEEYSKLQMGLFDSILGESNLCLEDKRAKLINIIEKLDSYAHNKAASLIRNTKGTITVAVIIAGLGTMVTGQTEIGAAIMAASHLVSEYFGKNIALKISEIYKDLPLLNHYWSLLNNSTKKDILEAR